VPVGPARMFSLSSRPARAGYSISLAALLVVIGCARLQNAVAEGDTRTISFHHTHTDEDLTVTYKVNGRYVEEALKQINHELRDWRKDETIAIDPHLIDLVWEVRRELESNEPIWVICGYRSPATNAMLRRRSSGVAKSSQHMLGKALDFYIPGVPLEKLRETGLRAQRGGVGFYPSSHFVHLDTGSVWHWPRVPEPQLAQIIAKGPLSSAHAGDRPNTSDPTATVASAVRVPHPVGKLLGRGEDEDKDHADSGATRTAASSRAESPRSAASESRAVASVPIPPAKPAVSIAAKTEMTIPGFTVASASSRPATINRDPAGQGSSSANEVLSARGYWQGLPELDAKEASLTDQRSGHNGEPPRPPLGIPVAAADPGAAGTLAPWPMPSREPEGGMLAYAPVNSALPSSRPGPMGTAATREPLQPATTVAIKRSGNRPTIVASPQASGPTRSGQRLNDPWTRAVIVTPSADGFMSTSRLGAPDYRMLSPYLRKPAMSVMMTFCGDPYLGMSAANFSGPAVVFVSTVTFYERTASLH
jgi:uncharacterized protein YcbK (DUF882 family)